MRNLCSVYTLGMLFGLRAALNLKVVVYETFIFRDIGR